MYRCWIISINARQVFSNHYSHNQPLKKFSIYIKQRRFTNTCEGKDLVNVTFTTAKDNSVSLNNLCVSKL